MVGLNFNGNHTVLDDPAILPSYASEKDAAVLEEERGGKAERWAIEEAVARGYGVATIWCNDFAPDDAKAYSSRVISLFDEPEFKAVGAWAFGIMRGVDYLVQDADVDAARIADIGHSRLGKAAVWAGANDERIALVISNDSGNTGASLTRENRGETLKSINALFPHWFCTKYKEYGADAASLPVDQHLLLACIAPRPGICGLCGGRPLGRSAGRMEQPDGQPARPLRCTGWTYCRTAAWLRAKRSPMRARLAGAGPWAITTVPDGMTSSARTGNFIFSIWTSI